MWHESCRSIDYSARFGRRAISRYLHAFVVVPAPTRERHTTPLIISSCTSTASQFRIRVPPAKVVTVGCYDFIELYVYITTLLHFKRPLKLSRVSFLCCRATLTSRTIRGRSTSMPTMISRAVGVAPSSRGT